MSEQTAATTTRVFLGKLNERADELRSRPNYLQFALSLSRLPAGKSK